MVLLLSFFNLVFLSVLFVIRFQQKKSLGVIQILCDLNVKVPIEKHLNFSSMVEVGCGSSKSHAMFTYM